MKYSQNKVGDEAMSIQFTRSKIRYVVAGLFAVLLIVFLCTEHLVPLFQTAENVPARVTGILVFLMAFTLWEVRLPDVVGKVISAVFLMGIPFFSVWTIESLQKGVLSMSLPVYWLNLLLVAGVYFLMFALSDRVRFSVIVGSLLFLILGIANYYMMKLRNAPLQPWDILAAQTAVNVLPGLEFKLSEELINLVSLTALIWGASIQLQYEVTGFRRPARWAVSGGAAVIAVLLLVTSVPRVSASNTTLTVDAWNTADAAKKNGYIANFVLNLKTITNAEPDGYSKQRVNEVVEKAAADYHETKVTSTKKPNVIAIMNEAFSDLSVLGDTNLSEDVMPFVHSLKKNTVRGNLVVPVFGGGTCNTEYEFLTGNVCYMLRSGSYPMQQFVSRSSPSLATTLKAQGYTTVGMHPLYGTSWNRSRAYPFLGFDKFVTINDFKEPQKLREYITDQQNYDQIIAEYQKKGDKPMFLFNVTVQNHGGYAWDDNNLVEDITFPNSQKYRNARQYYALVRESDKALENLVRYFEEQDEPTVIVFFGDHQPALETDYYNELLKGKSDLQKNIDSHTVPFFIWANYDIDAKDMGTISVNYLQNVLLKTTGLTMTPYNKYLESLYEKMPILSSVVCMDNKGNYYNYQDKQMPYASQIQDYHIVQYNEVFDRHGRQDLLFYLAPKG